ncbi:hypothetical protein GCM10027079_16760 [Sediminivirga luteola]|uniref:Uncharacterized protein n=1 Tax=Sediminivirga luteola TaxID=1774748 RepID=A0A8J2TVN7_9MICO|nr:hypothetical protein GCM10011333_04220 [Sediminivirga luteola]
MPAVNTQPARFGGTENAKPSRLAPATNSAMKKTAVTYRIGENLMGSVALLSQYLMSADAIRARRPTRASAPHRRARSPLIVLLPAGSAATRRR